MGNLLSIPYTKPLGLLHAKPLILLQDKSLILLHAKPFILLHAKPFILLHAKPFILLHAKPSWSAPKAPISLTVWRSADRDRGKDLAPDPWRIFSRPGEPGAALQTQLSFSESVSN